MKRKLIGLSTSTNVISLPTAWLRKNGLEKGAELDVDEKDNLLVISKDAKRTTKKISLDISRMNEDLIWLILDAAYMSGYDDILLKTGNPSQAGLLTNAAKDFPGLIIYDEKKDLVRLKNVSVQEEFDLTQLISRIRNMTVAIMDDCIDALKTKQWDVLYDIKKRDYTINTYVSLAFRHLNTYGYSPAGKQSAMAQYIKMLEMFSDRLCAMLMKIAEKKDNSKTQTDILTSLKELYREEATLISKFNLDRLGDFDDKRIKLIGKGKSIDKTIQVDLTRLAMMFFEIEEIAAQLNL